MFSASSARAPQTEPAPQRQRGSGNPLVDTANATGTGFMRGALRLAGLPVDTAANVLDLGKAALGAPYTAVTGKAAPDWLQVGDRAKVPGSGDWLIDRARRTGLGRFMVDPSNPEFEGGYSQAIGAGLTAGLAPGSLPQALNRAGIGALSAASGKATFDATGSPELAIAASLLPTGAQSGAEWAVKRVVRGGEQGRQEMRRRVAELERAGIDRPTLGLATGNPLVEGLENILSVTPGASGRITRARDQAISGLQARTMEAAEAASPVRGSLPAGQQVQAGIRDFRDAFKGRQSQLYDELDRFIARNSPTAVPATAATLEQLNAGIPGAPALSRFFRNGKVQAIEEALQSDLGQGRAYTPSQLRSAVVTNPQSAAQLSAALNEGTLPYQAVKQTRTMVGIELADHSLLSDVPRSKWTPLYGSLTKDMEAAANQAGPGAAQAFNRANTYTRAGMDRLETLRPFADRAAPEQAFTSLVGTARENASVLAAVKKSLPEGARGTVAGTVIERLGRAAPGQQNDLSDTWSPQRFLSNWNGMKPEARRELFSGFPHADQVRADVEAVARATSMMRDGSRMWANPSGTAGGLSTRALVAGGGLGWLLNPWIPMGIGSAVVSANAAARGLTSDGVRRYLMEPDTRASLLAPATTAALGSQGLLGGPAGYSPPGLLAAMQAPRPGLLELLALPE